VRSARKSTASLLYFGCVLFVYLFMRLGAAEIFSHVLRVGWYFALITVIYVAYQMIRASAYWKCVADNKQASYWDIVRIRLSGEAIQFITSSGPFLAEPAKVWLLRRRGLSTKRATAATVAEYLIYTFTSAAFAIAGLTYLLNNFELSRPASVAAKIIVLVMGIFLLAAASAILCRVYLIGMLVKEVSRLPVIRKSLHFDEKDVTDTEDLLFAVLRDRPLRFLSILAVEFAAQALLVLELIVLLRAIGQPFRTRPPALSVGSPRPIRARLHQTARQIGQE